MLSLRSYLVHTHEDDKHGSVSCLATVEQLPVVPPALIRTGLGNIFYHFPVFELHNGRVTIAFSVIVGQDLERGFVLVLGDEPTRGLDAVSLSR